MVGSWKTGSTRRWRRIRAAVLERDRHRCRVRLASVCIGVATHVHHTRGRRVTGDDPRFLVAACEPCNLAIGDPQKRVPKPRKVTQW